MGLYPEIEPHEQGMLDVGDGNLVHWEVWGDPQGKPAVAFHGGPGSGCGRIYGRLFDPSAYRIVLFDQRGSGKSTPNAAAHDTDLSTNTTWHLIADIERLRTLLGIKRWLVLGISWGSTLGFAYAEAHPDRVSELVLGAVTSGRRSEVDWMIHTGAPRFFPEAWAVFRALVPRPSAMAASYRPTRGCSTIPTPRSGSGPLTHGAPGRRPTSTWIRSRSSPAASPTPTTGVSSPAW